jgi:hypothetical protein
MVLLQCVAARAAADHQRDSGLMPGVRVDVTGGYVRVPHAVRGTD